MGQSTSPTIKRILILPFLLFLSLVLASCKSPYESPSITIDMSKERASASIFIQDSDIEKISQGLGGDITCKNLESLRTLTKYGVRGEEAEKLGKKGCLVSVNQGVEQLLSENIGKSTLVWSGMPLDFGVKDGTGSSLELFANQAKENIVFVEESSQYTVDVTLRFAKPIVSVPTYVKANEDSTVLTMHILNTDKTVNVPDQEVQKVHARQYSVSPSDIRFYTGNPAPENSEQTIKGSEVIPPKVNNDSQQIVGDEDSTPAQKLTQYLIIIAIIGGGIFAVIIAWRKSVIDKILKAQEENASSVKYYETSSTITNEELAKQCRDVQYDPSLNGGWGFIDGQPNVSVVKLTEGNRNGFGGFW